jgi:hypothetical protein
MSEDYPNWFLWAYQKGFVFWLSIAGAFGLALLLVVIHLDDSVHDTEVRIQQELNRVGDELQDGETQQTEELQEIRGELEAIRRELKEIREGS